MRYSDGVATIVGIMEGLCYPTPVGPASLITESHAEMTIMLSYQEMGAGAAPCQRGTVCLILSHGLPTTLGANLRGYSDQGRVTLELATDAAYELANVMTGNLLPLVYGKEREFQLSSPRRCPYPSHPTLDACSLTTEEAVLSWAHVEKLEKVEKA